MLAQNSTETQKNSENVDPSIALYSRAYGFTKSAAD